jgi:hypothetical protein
MMRACEGGRGRQKWLQMGGVKYEDYARIFCGTFCIIPPPCKICFETADDNVIFMQQFIPSPQLTGGQGAIKFMIYVRMPFTGYVAFNITTINARLLLPLVNGVR